MTESTTSTEVQTLIQEGNAALFAGEPYQARQYFRRAIDIDPEQVGVWVGMAGAVRPYREKQEYLQRALELDPGNAEIQTTLHFVEAKLDAGEVLAPREANTATPEPVVADTPVVAAPESLEHVHTASEVSGETMLSCISCGKPITDTRHVTWSPVGQLCADCTKERLPANYKVSGGLLALVGGLSLVTSLVLSYLVISFLVGIPFSLLISFFAAPFVAEGLLRGLDRITRGKRGKNMQRAVGVGMGLGAAPFALLLILLRAIFPLILLALFIGIVSVTLVRRLR